ncbi:hypothetical protein D046_7668A, partial [Vibrio parahaemolyticus V-223/04]
MKVIVKRFALSQKLRGEDDIFTSQLFLNSSSIANRNSRLNHHYCIRIDGHNIFNHGFNRRCIKVIS